MSGADAVVFLDFDGTITVRDATDAILETFADPEWQQLEKAWSSGRIGSRECLAAQMALVTATRDQLDLLLGEIGVDPGFAMLLEACAARAVPVHIVSDGFDYCIGRILGCQHPAVVQRLTNSQIVSSTLRLDQGRWRATFTLPPEPCAHGCATCKPAAMARLKAPGAIAIFVGDGMSDRYAATCADIVFAKDTLAAYCETVSIPYTPYATLATVAGAIERLLRSGLTLPGSLSEKGFPTV
jgi:2,3-diketo-5-methylthio-1-phosphopentane phosphatase